MTNVLPFTGVGLIHLRRLTAACVVCCLSATVPLGLSTPSSEREDRSLELIGDSPSLQLVARLIDEGRFDAARQRLLAEVNEQGSNYQTHFLEARILFGERRFQDSLNALQKSFSNEKRDPRVYLLAGMNWVLLDRLDLARPFFEQAVKLAPANDMMHYHLGRYYYTAQHFAMAEREFREVVRLQPEAVKGYDNLALALEAQSKDEEAIECYRKAIDLAEQQHLKTEWPYLNLAKFLLAKGHADESLSLARKAGEKNPRSAEVYYVQGKALQRIGKDDEAVQALLRSIEIDPKFSESHYLLGRIYLKQGRKAEGQNEMETFQLLKQGERNKPSGMGGK
jgi:tetratricopeptide (TPR) repeat protein